MKFSYNLNKIDFIFKDIKNYVYLKKGVKSQVNPENWKHQSI